MKKILAVIDMQKDFIDGALGSPEAQAIVPEVIDMINTFRGDVVFTKDTHSTIYPLTQEGKKLPIPHCIKNTAGWELDSLIEPLSKGKKIFEKPTFGSVALANYIADNAYSEVEIIGLCTDICVISNALLIKAFLPEVKITVHSSCCAGTTPENHQNALNAMAVCQIETD